GEVVGGMEALDRFLPAAAIHQVVPVGNDVSERAAFVAKRDAAIHAARALLTKLVFRKLALELAPVPQPLLDRSARRHLARDLHESSDLAHGFACLSRRTPLMSFAWVRTLCGDAPGRVGRHGIRSRPASLRRCRGAAPRAPCGTR